MSIRHRRTDDDEWERQKEHPADEPQRRSFREPVLAGLMLDTASLLALSAAVLAGVIPAGHMIVPAVTLAIFIAFGAAYLYITRRP